MRNTEFAKVRWRRGSGRGGSAVPLTIQASSRHGVLGFYLAIEPTKVRAEGLTKDPGAHRSCQDQAAKIRGADLPDSAVNLLTCILNWPEGSLVSP